VPSFDLSDAELAALIALLRETIAADRFPLSPRVRALRRVLDKLETQPPGPEPLPPPKPPGERVVALSKSGVGRAMRHRTRRKVTQALAVLALLVILAAIIVIPIIWVLYFWA